ncbi:hypothetical protein E6H35_03265 [Candidatus Bathyarchaeota archaeon]|nr:MAG: hypothetical protein E6H35_03265 [Candidatus Bathyarchaeota archaeon]
MKGTFRHGKTVLPLLLAILVGSGLVAAPALVASSRPSNTPTSTNTTTTSKGTQPGFTGLVAGPASTTTQSKQSNQPSQLLLGPITPVLMILVALILSLGANSLARRRNQ